MNLFLKTQFGSHVYGTNLPTSDHDFKGIMVPDFRDLLLQRAPKVLKETTKTDRTARNTQDDIDFEIFSLHYWFELFQQGQTLCYDMLFVPTEFILVRSPIWDEIVKNKDKIINSKIAAFAGYCQSQAAKYSLKGSNLFAYRLATEFFKRVPPRIRLSEIRAEIESQLIQVAAEHMKYNDADHPLIEFTYILHKGENSREEEYLKVGPKTQVPMSASAHLAADIYQRQFNKYGERAKLAETNEGVDWKALMHAVRICYEAQELLLTGHITFPRPEKELLLRIRKGELGYRHVSDLIIAGLDDLYSCKAKSTLRAEPDRAWIVDFIYQTYSSYSPLPTGS